MSGLLERVYSNPRHHNKDDPLDELVFILLSSKTTERSYLNTYDALGAAYPGWFPALDAPRGSVASVIKHGGLSRKKETQLRAMLRKIRDETDGAGLSVLRGMKTRDAERLLCALPGVGLKSARCVLLYSLGRSVFPVDTHCRRVLSRLGVIKFRRLTDGVQTEIQDEIPPELRYSLHVNLVAHGRAVCTPRAPKCGECGVRKYCQYYARPNLKNPPGSPFRTLPAP